MADMIKFYKGLEASLPASGANGALYITTDEGAIYLGTGTSMKRLGDFVQVANVAALPAKAHENCLYYCVAENILAKWNGTEWKQVNKQPTVDELKTLLGLGSMAYKSEVAEGDLSAELKEKVNAAAEGNHSHSNKTVLDGITSEKVTAWDASEKNAKDHADGLNTAMNTRVEALEAIDHEHANKAELDLIVAGDKAKWDVATEKAHTHTFNETELNKIVEGDVAKWNGVAADHLTSADKTTLENSIKEAKKAGTDANTNIETYKVTNDARVLAVEEDVAEITNGENGILAQAKAYSDGKLATARTEITAEIDADVKAVADDLAGYKTSNNEALAGVKATAEAAATKTYTDEELSKKVDKVEGKSLIADTEITRLAGMSDGANKVEKSDVNGNIKIDGAEVVVYTHPEKHAISDVTGLQDALDGKSDEGHTHTKSEITDFAHTHTASEVTDLDATIKAYDYATKTEAQSMADSKDDAIAAAKKSGDDAQADVNKLREYVGTIPADEKYADITNVISYVNKKAEETLAAAQGGSSETAASVKQQLDNYKSENDTRVKAVEDAVGAIEEDYLTSVDKTELSDAIGAEKTRAEGIEAGLRTDVDAIKGDYLKASDKEDLQTQINTIMSNPDAEGAINSINEFTQYVKDHGTIAEGMRVDINKNKDDITAINDETTGILAQAKADAKSKADTAEANAKSHADTEIAKDRARLDILEAIDHEAYIVADETLKSELQAEIDADVKVVNDAFVEYKGTNDAEVAKKANSADVYTKTEIYTKDEVDAAVEAAVTEATSWGSF